MLLQFNNLSVVKQNHLRKLLDSEGFPVLIEVLVSKFFEIEVEAINEIEQGTAGYMAKAALTVEKSKQVIASIELLQQLRNQKESVPFKISSATPSIPTTKF